MALNFKDIIARYFNPNYQPEQQQQPEDFRQSIARALNNNNPVTPRPGSMSGVFGDLFDQTNDGKMRVRTSTPMQADVNDPITAGVRVAKGIASLPKVLYDMVARPSQREIDFEKDFFGKENPADIVGNKIYKPALKGVFRVANPGLEAFADDVAETKVANEFARRIEKGELPPEALDQLKVLKKSGLQIVGDTAMAVLSAYMPSVAGKTIGNTAEKTILQAFKTGAKEGGVQGLQFGIAQALSSGETDPEKIAEMIAVNTGGGALVGGSASSIIPTVSKTISETNKLKAEIGGQGGFAKNPFASSEGDPFSKESITERFVKDGVNEDRAQIMAEQAVNNGTLFDQMGYDKNQKKEAMDKMIGNMSNDIVDKKIPFADGSIKTTRENGFVTTVKESPNASDAVKEQIASNYNPIRNKDTLETAQQMIAGNRDEALAFARDEKAPATPESNAVAQLLAVEAQNQGKFKEAIDLFETTARRATKQGQAIQALSMFNKFTPEGVLKFASKVVDDANKTLPPKAKIEITDEVAKDLLKQSKKVEKLPDGEDKAVETAILIKKIGDLVPASIAEKISAYQTVAQLLNPKTIIRNTVGNAGFAGLENVSDVVGAGLDSALSLVTGNRSKVLPSIGVQTKGFKEGLRAGVRDALLGIDTNGLPTQFDIPNTGVFKGKVGAAAEKLLNVSLKANDRAMYKAAYDGSLYNQMKAAGVLEPTEAMKETAHFDGLYRTFQDDSALSSAFVTIKKALNLNKKFGIGDIILKYPKTPGNILSRGIAYSPAGFLKTAFELAQPLVGKEFNQKAFVESASRALVGSVGLIGSGALLHRLGIITGKREKDADIAQVQQETGLGQYKFNVSALKRFVLSGMNPDTAKYQEGDKLYSYDWFQPAAIGLSIGANIDEGGENGQSLTTTVIDSMASGIDTLAEQPLVQNLTRLLKFGDASDAIKGTAAQIPATFVPTILSQIRQLTDDTQRNTYDPDIINYAFNLAKNKIPGVSQTLQPKVGVFGDEQQVYQDGSNNLFNVFFNPAFQSTIKTTPESKMVLDLFEDTGSKTQAPRVIGSTQKVNGENIKLNAKQVYSLQRFVGTMTREVFNNLANDPSFQQQSSEDKVKYLSSFLSDIGSAGKIVILGDRPKKVSARTSSLINHYMKTTNSSPEGSPTL